MFKATTRTNATPRPRQARMTGRRVATVALLATVTLAGAACSPSKDSGELLVAQLPSEALESGSEGVTLWSADPGDTLDDSNVVATGVSRAAGVLTQDHSGNVWYNSVGRKWDGGTLMAYLKGQDGLLTAGKPGAEPAVLASPLATEPEVLLRGVFAQTGNGCSIAASSTDVTEVGTGECIISPQERYVISFGGTQAGATIKDIGKDTTTDVDLRAVGADALAKDDAALIVAQVDGGFQAVVLDATDGSERGRSGVFPAMQAGVAGKKSEGFVVQVRKSDGDAALLYIDSDGGSSEIDSGELLHPLQNGHEVTYLKLSADPDAGALKRWSKGHEAEVLLTGNVGGAAVDDHNVIASREADGVVELYRTNHGTGAMEKELEISAPDADPALAAGQAGGLAVVRTLLLNGYVHLALDIDGVGAYARLDLGGKHSEVPVEAANGLTLNALDADGTALLTRSGDDSAELTTVRLHDHDPDVRVQAGGFGASFMRAGKVYFTDMSNRTNPSVRSVDAIGSDLSVTTLWESKMLVGATWPQAGGATETTFVTHRLFVEQQRQAMQQQQAAPQMQPSAG